MTRFRSLAAALLVIVTTAAARPEGRPIRVDGDKSDWRDDPTFMADGRYDGTITVDGNYHQGGDLLALRIRNTPCEVDFLVELAAFPDTTVNLFLDTDGNELTGCREFLGAEYLLRVVQIPGVIAPQVQFVDWRTCSFPTTGDLSVGAAFAIGRDSIELSIPVAALQAMTPDAQGFYVYVSAGLEGDTAADFQLPPLRYDARPRFSESCSNRPLTPGRGGSIHAGGFALPPPLLP